LGRPVKEESIMSKSKRTTAQKLQPQKTAVRSPKRQLSQTKTKAAPVAQAEDPVGPEPEVNGAAVQPKQPESEPLPDAKSPAILAEPSPNGMRVGNPKTDALGYVVWTLRIAKGVWSRCTDAAEQQAAGKLLSHETASELAESLSDLAKWFTQLDEWPKKHAGASFIESVEKSLEPVPSGPPNPVLADYLRPYLTLPSWQKLSRILQGELRDAFDGLPGAAGPAISTPAAADRWVTFHDAVMHLEEAVEDLRRCDPDVQRLLRRWNREQWTIWKEREAPAESESKAKQLSPIPSEPVVGLGGEPERATAQQCTGTTIEDASQADAEDSERASDESRSANQNLPRCHVLAHDAYEHAVARLEPGTNAVTDRAVYDYLQNVGQPDGYDLPSYNTWCRYVRGFRKAAQAQKNSPRVGRVGRSVIRASDR
jgi:hypothetical protein